CRDWMSALPEELWDVPLTHLAIPSHDAMSYCLDINSPLVRAESDFFRLLDGVFSCFTRPAIFRWATTQQDKTIEEQLSMGIRYFDLRVAHKPNDSSSDLYFTHVIYTHVTVLETLESVAAWLEAHPKEIVILACSHFEGMDDKCHESFIWSLKKLFGSKLCPQKESALTLRSLWASGYQVILSYECQLAVRHQELWPPVPYWWANQRRAHGVMTYLDWHKDLGRPGFFVSGLNLTADRYYITKNQKESLRTLTYSNWEYVRTWLEEQSPGSDAGSLNIIAGDFVGSLPLCSAVIALN
uniref:PI-PLC X domain-containing protein 1-like n=1 Tax=Pundamilia nyererei TaxID=303518 RepID=A0A3B4EQP7_9CICH